MTGVRTFSPEGLFQLRVTVAGPQLVASPWLRRGRSAPKFRLFSHAHRGSFFMMDIKLAFPCGLTLLALAGCKSVPIALSAPTLHSACAVEVLDARDEPLRHRVQVMHSGDLMLGTGQLVWESTSTPEVALRSTICKSNNGSPPMRVQILKLTASFYGALNHSKCDVELVVSVDREGERSSDLVQPANVRDEETGRSTQAICGEAIDKSFERVANRITDQARSDLEQRR